MIVITEHRTGLLTSFQECARDTPARTPWHLSCGKAGQGTSTARTNCRQVQHWTENLLDRLDRHAKGTGARLIEVITQAGIGFTLVRICEGTRHTERAIKNARCTPRCCPACTPRPCNGHWSPMPGDFTPRSYPSPDLAGRR